MKAVETPIGFIPAKEDLPLEGLSVPEWQMEQLLAYDPGYWVQEAKRRTEWLSSLKEAAHSRIGEIHQRFNQAVLCPDSSSSAR